MKSYRSSRQLLAEMERVLAANRPAFYRSPLEDVVELLCRGRHYSWMGIYLAVGAKAPQQLLGVGGDTHPGQLSLPETRSKILVSMKLATRELGVLDVESNRENAFGSEDRVLLENVATRLARFLAGPGKYLVRKARAGAAAAASPQPQARGPQTASSKPLRSAAVGEK